MAVEVAACVDVGEADGLAAHNRGTAVAQGVAAPPDTPVTVTVFDRGHARHRLLSTACVNNKHVETERRDVLLYEKVTTDATEAVNIGIRHRVVLQGTSQQNPKEKSNLNSTVRFDTVG